MSKEAAGLAMKLVRNVLCAVVTIPLVLIFLNVYVFVMEAILRLASYVVVPLFFILLVVKGINLWFHYVRDKLRAYKLHRRRQMRNMNRMLS